MADYDRPPRILVVEDDTDIADVLQRSLRLEGYDVRVAPDGQAGARRGARVPSRRVVLDLGLPKIDGVEVARALRRDESVPILMLTARDAVEATRRRPRRRRRRLPRQAVRAPGAASRGSARCCAARRRAARRPLRVGDLQLNPDTHEVARGEREIELTQREFELLEYLMRNERIVISRQRLLDEVWGYDPFSTTNTIEVFVSNLRRKLEADDEPRLLHTIRGAGYVLRA